jgi:hypothetical protein
MNFYSEHLNIEVIEKLKLDFLVLKSLCEKKIEHLLCKQNY